LNSLNIYQYHSRVSEINNKISDFLQLGCFSFGGVEARIATSDVRIRDTLAAATPANTG
jgi:hypothetical protein